ncbi:hypothetical protein BV22DRAFT_377731 [Leucogyrophana mollusca]|uniref:Uncharacterized protein n=1 Tax=Leucogyrophana mollusca TaxID=85980 RepID=A0ACB8BMP3_9AGAM|nr:hypothetical protein BV22DRAFT_377731 [Leucogyrophana mollusca]
MGLKHHSRLELSVPNASTTPTKSNNVCSFSISKNPRSCALRPQSLKIYLGSQVCYLIEELLDSSSSHLLVALFPAQLCWSQMRVCLGVFVHGKFLLVLAHLNKRHHFALRLRPQRPQSCSANFPPTSPPSQYRRTAHRGVTKSPSMLHSTFHPLPKRTTLRLLRTVHTSTCRTPHFLFPMPLMPKKLRMRIPR